MENQKIFTVLVFLLLGMLNLGRAQDTISVELGDKAIVLIVTKDHEGLKRVRELDLNQIIRDVTTQLDTAALAQQKEVKTYEYQMDPTSHRLTLMEVKPEENTYSSKPSTTEDSFEKYTEIHLGSRIFWAVEFGLNNYLENGQFPDTQGKSYGVETIQSRFFATGLYQRTNLGGTKTPLSLQFGLELSWFNFMFQEDNYLVENENSVEFRDYVTDFGNKLQKSKLTVPYLNLPLTLNLRFRNRQGRRTFNLGAGGYIGYRLGGHTKLKLEGDSIKERNNFFLNNWRYGLEAQAGYRHFLLFFKYDLNDLFVQNKGPKLNAFAFGIRI
ncbi:MAG: hypothetical protein NW226_07790 [Microscillaceae bacterium]|nr:hypothetical protein [Microscillaceae bacterium]